MIESLNSPHIGRVKALIGYRGNKERDKKNLFVAEGLQCLREALKSNDGPKIESLYLTAHGRKKVESLVGYSELNIVDVSDEVMKQMCQTQTPQGVLAVCQKPQHSFSSIKLNGRRRFIYLHEIADPGNAGTILRSADAFGMDGVITSPGSVDMFSPKVVRSTAGSLWHIPVFEEISIDQLLITGMQAFCLGVNARDLLIDYHVSGDVVAVFGNEAHGLSETPSTHSLDIVKIAMPGQAESLNLSVAASIVMYHLSNIPTS